MDSFEFDSRQDANRRTGPITVKADIEFRLGTDGRSFLLRLVVESSSAKGDGSPYDFGADAVARFSLNREADTKEVGRLIAVNSSAVLYGAVRGYIATATALGTHGPLFLPTVDLTPAFSSAWDRYMRELPEGDDADRESGN